MSRTQAKVAAVNRANAYAVELYDTLAPVFLPYLGQQVTKKDGSLLAKVQKGLPELPSTPSLHVYRGSSDYSIYYVVKTCEHDSNTSCLYHETSVYVGNIRKGVLESIHKRPEGLRTDWTADEIRAGRERVKEARQALSDAESAIYPFGEYDR